MRQLILFYWKYLSEICKSLKKRYNRTVNKLLLMYKRGPYGR